MWGLLSQVLVALRLCFRVHANIGRNHIVTSEMLALLCSFLRFLCLVTFGGVVLFVSDIGPTLAIYVLVCLVLSCCLHFGFMSSPHAFCTETVVDGLLCASACSRCAQKMARSGSLVVAGAVQFDELMPQRSMLRRLALLVGRIRWLGVHNIFMPKSKRQRGFLSESQGLVNERD